MKMLGGILVIALLLFCETGASATALRAAPPGQVACTAEAKMCPDGSAVSRTGPNCEFAPCPGESGNFEERMPYPDSRPPVDQGGFAPGSPGTADQGDVVQGGGMVYGTPGSGVVASPVMPLEPLPDMPMEQAPPTPLGVKFLVEHRSAFAGQRVTVSGIVIYVLTPEQACPSGSGGPCAQPRIILSDTGTTRSDPRYDLPVMLPQKGEAPYKLGQTVDVTGTVAASADGVVLHP